MVAALALCSMALSYLVQLNKENFENYVRRTEVLVVTCKFFWLLFAASQL